jgi:hypothetical protein
LLFDEIYGARRAALPDSVTEALLALARARSDAPRRPALTMSHATRVPADTNPDSLYKDSLTHRVPCA